MQCRYCLILTLILLASACKPVSQVATEVTPVQSTTVEATRRGDELPVATQPEYPKATSLDIPPADTTVIIKAVMNQQYGDHFDAKLGCWPHTAELINDSYDYCMRPGAPHLLDINGEKHLYFSAVNRMDILNDPRYSYGHISPGLMGAFKVKIESPAQWKLLAASKELDLGSGGNCGCKNAKFVQLGPTYYGWMFASGGVWQGLAVFKHSLIASHGDQFEDISSIPQVTEDEQDTEYEMQIDDTNRNIEVFPLLLTKTKPGIKSETFKISFDHERWQYDLANRR